MQADALNLLVLPLVQRIALAYLAMALVKLAFDAIEWLLAARGEAAYRDRVARLVFPRSLTRREEIEPRPRHAARSGAGRRTR